MALYLQFFVTELSHIHELIWAEKLMKISISIYQILKVKISIYRQIRLSSNTIIDLNNNRGRIREEGFSLNPV